MNERIKQLVLDSELVYEDNGNLHNRYEEYVDLTQYLEKFAELIVRECAGIYSKIDNGNLHMGTDNYLEALHKTFRS